MPPPPVSIVIPAYNHERFVGEAIDSVLSQTFADFELIVVDDGSRDSTAAIVESRAAADGRIRLIRQANGGSHAAINRGIAESSGQWVAILNSDDRYARGRLERLVAEASSGARFVVTDVRLIDAAGAPITDPDHWWHRAHRDFRESARRLGPVHGLLYGNYTISTSNFFFARSLADTVGPFRPRRNIPDWDWALRAVLSEPDRSRYLWDSVLLDYRLHGDNAILGDFIRGDCEINRLHRELLARFGAPHALVSAIYRNQRDLRRAWRARGTTPIERYVRQREKDIESLASDAHALRQALDERTADLLSQRAQIESQTRVTESLESALDSRDRDIASLKLDVDVREKALIERSRDIDRQAEEIAHLANTIAGLRDEHARLGDAHARLRDEHTLLRDEHDRLQGDHGRLQHEHERIRVELAASDQARQALATNLHHLEQALTASNALVNEAQSSLTWRVVRRVRRYFGIGRK